MRLHIPKGELRNIVMNDLHDARCSGHLGIKRTIDLVKRDFYLPTLEKYVTIMSGDVTNLREIIHQIRGYKECCSC